jgi:hypothetical protein
MRDRLTLTILFEKDIQAADAYDALDKDNEEFRRMWLQEKLDEAKAQASARVSSV